MKNIITAFRTLIGLGLFLSFNINAWAEADDSTYLTPTSPDAPAPVMEAPTPAPTPSPSPAPALAPNSALTPIPAPPPPTTEGMTKIFNGYFYYCTKESSYFPTITSCADGWVAIPVNTSVPVKPWSLGTTTPPNSKEAVVSRPNSLTFEFLGRAFLYSLNYDRAISPVVTLGIGISNWSTSDWWNNNYSRVTVLPIYANYYFSEEPSRGYLSAGLDFISVNPSGNTQDTFANTGAAVTLGGGFESRNNNGFIFRLGGYFIVGRTTTLSPVANIGLAF